MNLPLTKKQQAIFDWTKAYIAKKKYAPTHAELADRFQISVAAIQGHLRLIIKKEYLGSNGMRRGLYIPKQK